MSRKCKCRYCGKTLTVKEAYKHEDLTDNLIFIREYYCTEQCFLDLIKSKEIKEDCFIRFDRILEIKTETNLYFRKMIKDVAETYGYEVIQKYLIAEEVELIEKLNSIRFSTPNGRINYFLAIIQNSLLGYKQSLEEEKYHKTVGTSIHIEEFDEELFTARTRKRKKRRNLDEIFDE